MTTKRNVSLICLLLTFVATISTTSNDQHHYNGGGGGGSGGDVIVNQNNLYAQRLAQRSNMSSTQYANSTYQGISGKKFPKIP